MATTLADAIDQIEQLAAPKRARAGDQGALRATRERGETASGNPDAGVDREKARTEGGR
jgi:hypothetical protein